MQHPPACANSRKRIESRIFTVAALFCYYILYWFIPRFFMDLWLYFAIYIAIPAQVFFMLLGTLAVVGVAGLLSSK